MWNTSKHKNRPNLQQQKIAKNYNNKYKTNYQNEKFGELQNKQEREDDMTNEMWAKWKIV